MMYLKWAICKVTNGVTNGVTKIRIAFKIKKAV